MKTIRLIRSHGVGPGRPRQRGIAMFETLIAILVVSLGVIGFMELLKFSLRNNDSAGYRTQASFMASEIMDRMRANRSDALTGSYNIGCTDPDPEDESEIEEGGTSGTVTNDLTQWCGNIAATLPLGQGSVSCSNTTSSCEVSIQWNDSRGTAGSAAQVFTVRSLL